MTTDTITIPAEIPREIRDGDKVLKVVGFKYGPLTPDDWYWCESSQKFQKFYASLANTIFLKPITEPVPRYIYPTPVEACRMIADAGKPILCDFYSLHGEWCPGRLRWVELEPTGVVKMPFCILNYGWVEKIRVLQPE